MGTISLFYGLAAGTVIVQAVGYIVHRLAHYPISGKLYQSHMFHHAKAYPPGRYTSKKYLNPDENPLKMIFVTAFAIVNMAVLILCPLLFFIGFFLSTAICSLANEYVHDAFHVENHPLARLPGFMWLSDLHKVHHENVKKNFGIYLFWFDRMFGTFKKLKRTRHEDGV